MKIYIDYQEFEQKKKYKNFGTLVNELMKQLDKEKKMIDKFYIDGKEIEDYRVYEVDKIKLLEIYTVSHNKIILKALTKLIKDMEDFFDLLDEMQTPDEKNGIFEVNIGEIMFFLRGFYNILDIFVNDETFCYEVSELVYIREELLGNIKDLTEAFEENNFEVFFSILETEVVVILENFYKYADEYLEIVENDEKRKKLLN